jgi:hypothetical protein
MTMKVAFLRGLAQMMYDMVDNPNLMHHFMAFLRDGTMALLDYLEAEGLLSLNNDGAYVGSGGLGWSKELPQPDFQGKVRLRDMWGFAESQETVGVSPRMFAEFIFPYQLPILKRFGLNCYGCCEPLDGRWHVIKQIQPAPFRVSPWANLPKMAYSRIQCIFSLKPRPSDLAVSSRRGQDTPELRETFESRAIAAEATIKPYHRQQSTKRDWCCQIAREEAERPEFCQENQRR